MAIIQLNTLSLSGVSGPGSGDGSSYEYILTADTLIPNLTGIIQGEHNTLVIRQDAGGNHNVTFDANFVLPVGGVSIGMEPFDSAILDYYVIDNSKVVLVHKTDFNTGV